MPKKVHQPRRERRAYRGISLPDGDIRAIEAGIQKAAELGIGQYTSTTDFIKDAVRRRLEELERKDEARHHAAAAASTAPQVPVELQWELLGLMADAAEKYGFANKSPEGVKVRAEIRRVVDGIRRARNTGRSLPR